MPSAPTIEKPKVTRREFLRTGIWLGAGSVALGSYATIVEPNQLRLRNVDVWLPRLPAAFDGFRIAQISDIHFGEFLGEGHVKDVVKVTNEAIPDLVAITGDFVTRHSGNPRFYKPDAKVAEPCALVLQQLHAKMGSIAVLGNHDHATDADFVTDALVSHGIPVLRNQVQPLERAGTRLWIAGVDDVLEHAADLTGTMAQVPTREACVLLVHEPDVADLVARHPVDLQLSGHSHGGQVRVPFLGAPILPPYARKYPLGHYAIRDLQLYTNPGVGLITLPIRFDCPPEITFLTLRAGKGD